MELSRFTFQYVSINTEPLDDDIYAVTKFTFQYVSINTRVSTPVPPPALRIYIPICFY